MAYKRSVRGETRGRPSSVAGAVACVMQDSRRRERAALSRSRPADLFTTWRRAHRDCGLDAPGRWGAKEASLAKSVQRWWPDDDIHDFLYWAVQEWTQIMEARFGGGHKPAPARPTIRWLAACRDTFREVWLDRREDDGAPDILTSGEEI